MDQRSPIETKIMTMADEVARREGCLLYDLKFVGTGNGRVLRVYIDKDPNGVSVDDCANVSRGLSLLLDVSDAVGGGSYDLEVSSPGLDRQLTADWHYKRAQGKLVELKTKAALELTSKRGTPILQRQFKGRVVDADEKDLKLEIDQQIQVIAISNIEKAKVVFEANLKKEEPKRG